MSKSESSDTQFFNSFSMVLGILIAFAIVLFAVARSIGADSQGAAVLAEPLHLASVQKNIAPFAQVAGPDMAFRNAVTFEISVAGYANPVRFSPK